MDTAIKTDRTRKMVATLLLFAAVFAVAFIFLPVLSEKILVESCFVESRNVGIEDVGVRGSEARRLCRSVPR